MPEYISREAAKDEMCERCSNVLMCTRSDNDCPIKRGLNSIPAADVVEVRHGEWVEVDGDDVRRLCECSICHDWVMIDYSYIANYCPHCGAKMDGGQDDV